MRVFSVPSFRFDLTPKIGAWNPLATFGTKIKDGDEVEFSPETLSTMVANWARRGYRLAMCLDHESAYPGRAPAAAFIDALAVFANGECVAFAAVDGDQTPPECEGREGLYGRLAQITPLGMDEKEGLANYAGISPFFTSDGKDEQGNSIGYELYDVAATNTPFQAGCALQFHRLSGAPSAPINLGVSMNPEMLKKLGLAEGCSPEEMSAAVEKYMSDAEAKMASFAEIAAKYEADKDAAAKMEADKADAAKMESDKDEDKDDAKMSAMSAILEAQRAKLERLEKREAEREAKEQAEREQRYEALADQAVAGGYPKEKRAALVKFARADFDGARDAVSHFLPKTGAPAHLFNRLSQNGAPASPGAPTSAREDSAPAEKVTVNKLGRFVESDHAFALEVERMADSKDPAVAGKIDGLLSPARRGVKFDRLLAAEKIVRAERPDLAALAE